MSTEGNSKDASRTKVTGLPNKALVKEEAGAWITRIDQGQLSAAEIADLQAWMGRSSFHRSYLEKLAENWDAMSVLEELAEMFPIAHETYSGEQAGLTIGSRIKYQLNTATWMVGLAAGCAFVIAMIWQYEFSSIEYQTNIGEQARWELNDGSQLKLNTNSRVEVDFSESIRVVHLLQGEASFDVAKNPNRPFLVYAGSGMVWAVGTAFNVRYISSGVVDVTVIEGTVKVYAETNVDKLLPDSVIEPMREAIATAGQSVQYKEVIIPEQALASDLDKKLAWQQGALIFSGETLEQALLEIARYTDKELLIVDPGIKDIQIGGHFKTHDIDALLDTLSKGFDLKVQQGPGNKILLSNKT